MTTTIVKRAKAMLGLSEPKPTTSAKPAQHKKDPPLTPYHSVSLVAGIARCPAATRAEGRRFMPEDAPTLPLPDCDRRRCSCRYQQHEDRRDDVRRLEDAGIGIDLWIGAERRVPKKRGRRKGDR
jgi:hypothetical protein